MQIKLSKTQWEKIGDKAGWTKEAALNSNIIVDLNNAVKRLQAANEIIVRYQREHGVFKNKEDFRQIFSKCHGITTGTPFEDWVWSQVDPSQTRTM